MPLFWKPESYQIIKSLSHHKRTSSILAAEIGVSIPTASNTFRNFRNIDVVRYKTKLNERVYRLRDTTVMEILDRLETFVEKIRTEKWVVSL